MKNYSLLFDDSNRAKYAVNIIQRDGRELYEPYFDEKSLYILTTILPSDKENALKVMYPLSEYKKELESIKVKLIRQFLILTVVALLISFLFAIYTLHPLRKAFFTLEEFIKDIIHDLNTPITSILINLKMMKKNDEVESITNSANAIAMLHKNLIAYLKSEKFKRERFDIKKVIDEQVSFFKSIYYYLDWSVEVESRIINSNEGAFSRIIYNLLSNACKYNRPDGYIKIYSTDSGLVIENSSYGIKRPNKIFKRFYKEGDRGLGVGLHIVKKLCRELDIKIKLNIKDKYIVKVILEF